MQTKLWPLGQGPARPAFSLAERAPQKDERTGAPPHPADGA